MMFDAGAKRKLGGSCLCGGVKYEIHGELSTPLNCHCSRCRKAQGAAFRTRALVKVDDFSWVRGEELLTYYESSPGNHRGFCRVCGAPIHSIYDNKPEVYGLPLGALDDDPQVKPAYHVFVGSKAPWYDITDALPRYAEFPPAGKY
jgi:hypothetical protein